MQDIVEVDAPASSRSSAVVARAENDAENAESVPDADAEPLVGADGAEHGQASSPREAVLSSSPREDEGAAALSPRSPDAGEGGEEAEPMSEFDRRLEEFERLLEQVLPLVLSALCLVFPTRVCCRRRRRPVVQGRRRRSPPSPVALYNMLLTVCIQKVQALTKQVAQMRLTVQVMKLGDEWVFFLLLGRPLLTLRPPEASHCCQIQSCLHYQPPLHPSPTRWPTRWSVLSVIVVFIDSSLRTTCASAMSISAAVCCQRSALRSVPRYPILYGRIELGRS